jgi:hypothetical protein
MSTTKVPDALRDVTVVDAAKITTGTIPEARITTLASTKLTGTVADARFPATLPASSGANLTALPAANLTGTIADARISASSVNAHVDLTAVNNDISLLALQTAINGNMTAFGLKNSFIEQFEDSTKIENLASGTARNTTNEYVSSVDTVAGSTQTLIPQATGTPITADTGSGVMNTGGALSKAFDGTLYEVASIGVQSQNPTFTSQIKFYETADIVTVTATGSFDSTDIVPQDAVNKSSVGLVVLYKDEKGTATTLNTHLVAKVRANTGQAYQTLVLAGAGTYSDGLKIAIAPAIAVTAGQALSYQLSFTGQTSSLETRVHGVAMTY